MTGSKTKRVREAPPHTRGSTPDQEQPERDHPGSPAHAGIDPGCPTGRCGTPRLPRTRGDRPAGGRLPSRPKPAPPHTRGSTPRPRFGSDRRRGSPAHAGIDRQPTRAGRSLVRLPRTRGDRPLPALWRRTAPGAPPHTRGSTRTFRPSPARARGSPAHAGIDPWRGRRRTPTPRLPRTRGDRPGDRLSMFARSGAPPHTRGSTRVVLLRHPGGRGSPAHAGIDPTPSKRGKSRRRLPRTRGDRPTSGSAFPASTQAPPHTRGSTLRAVAGRVRAGGSPAHAGIDR